MTKVSAENIIKYFIIIFIFTVPFVHAQSWTQLQTTNDPPPTANASSIYLPLQNKIVVFGGRTNSGSTNEIRALNLNTNEWENLTPPSGPMPAPRFTPNVLYDSSMNRILIWSGQGTELYNDVWAFDLTNNTWQELWHDGNVSGAPLKRYGTAAVFDPVRRRLITFAGFTTSGRFEDTWYFQVDSMRWTDKTNTFHPELRCLHSACITSDKQNMIIYGGQHNGSLSDTWSLNLNSYIWTNITPAVKPAGRWFSSVINTKTDKVVIFGGESTGIIHGDLWRYSVSQMTWDSINQGTLKPSARWGHASVYIPPSDKIIIFGGAEPGYRNDTWMFSNISTVGIKNVSSSIPDNFILYQNYPNPFNPVTKLRFSLTSLAGSNGKGLVTMKVYDITGKEVAVLVNSELSPGTYEFEFSGNGLSSGIYIYSLAVNGIKLDTKKMMLIK